MKVLPVFILGIAIGAGAVWYYHGNRDQSRPAGAAGEMNSAGSSMNKTTDDTLSSLKLHGDDIKDELARTGRVIRDKAQEAGHKISDATADTRITTTIKAKLVGDHDLSAWDVHVSTTDGVVTLSGEVTSPDLIGKAMALAMGTDGVRQVVSTLQLKSK